MVPKIPPDPYKTDAENRNSLTWADIHCFRIHCLAGVKGGRLCVNYLKNEWNIKEEEFYICTGWAQLIQSHSLARISFEISGNMD